jgi:integrase
VVVAELEMLAGRLPPICFHDLRHTFATPAAGGGHESEDR